VQRVFGIVFGGDQHGMQELSGQTRIVHGACAAVVPAACP
jgi:hypothetical protein